MEYTDYYVAKGKIETAKEIIEKEVHHAIIDDSQDDFFPFIVWDSNEDFENKWDWLLKVFDAEGGAWGFSLYKSGKIIIKATYGENSEWGIDLEDNGYEGDLNEAAEELGVKISKLEKCLNDKGVEKFCKLVGFEHRYMFYPYEREKPEGIFFMSEC